MLLSLVCFLKPKCGFHALKNTFLIKISYFHHDYTECHGGQINSAETLKAFEHFSFAFLRGFLCPLIYTHTEPQRQRQRWRFVQSQPETHFQASMLATMLMHCLNSTIAILRQPFWASTLTLGMNWPLWLWCQFNKGTFHYSFRTFASVCIASIIRKCTYAICLSC